MKELLLKINDSAYDKLKNNAIVNHITDNGEISSEFIKLILKAIENNEKELCIEVNK